MAGIVAALAGLGGAMLDGDLTVAELVVAAGLALTGAAGVYAVPNDPHAETRGGRRRARL